MSREPGVDLGRRPRGDRQAVAHRDGELGDRADLAAPGGTGAEVPVPEGVGMGQAYAPEKRGHKRGSREFAPADLKTVAQRNRAEKNGHKPGVDAAGHRITPLALRSWRMSSSAMQTFLHSSAVSRSNGSAISRRTWFQRSSLSRISGLIRAGRASSAFSSHWPAMSQTRPMASSKVMALSW